MPKKAILFIVFCTVSVSVRSQAREMECRKFIREGYRYLSLFQATDAIQQFQRSIQLAKTLDHHHLYAQALMGASQATWYAGNFHQAADTMKLALQYFADKDLSNRIGAWRILSNIYDDIGDYVNAFKAVQEAIALNKGLDRENELLSMIQIGRLYKNIGDYETALDYYKKVLAKWPTKGSYPYRELHNCLGDLYVAKAAPDSAHYYYRQAFTGYPKSPVIRLRLGELHLQQQHIDSASWFFDSLYKETIVSNDVNMGIGVTIGLGKVARARGDLSTALLLGKKAFERAMQKGIYKYRMDAAALLGDVYEDKGNTAQALYYQQLFHNMKDSAISDVYKGQLFAFKQKTMQAEQTALLAALKADKKLAQRTMLIIGLLSVLAIALIVFRHKHEKLRLKERTAEMEMQALLAQMNPHFIFNCLTAINHCILNKEPDKASEYLTRFSRLMRMVLVNANKKAISLEEELDMLHLYITMEQLRFRNAFDYTIQLQPGLQPSLVQVPCFILQPFCENAIWHGLLHKEGKGNLLITCHIEGKQLIVSIQDDGVGLTEAARHKTKNTEPMGLHLTATRLAIFNQGNRRAGPHFTIRDKQDNNGDIAGTEAIISINTRLSND
jgi:tetratricopeptide (TPR) repeat protein